MSATKISLKILNSKAILFIFAIAVIGFNFTFSIDKIDASIENEDSITIENLLKLHNDERESKGLKPLRLNDKLSLSAQNKVKSMLGVNCWSHYCPEGKSPWNYFEESGYEYQIAGENLAEGFYDINEMMRAWLNSDSHKDNILKSQFEDVGFGIVSGDFQGKNNNIIVAVHFGTTNKKAAIDLKTEIFIDFPKNNQVFSTDNFEIKGRAIGTESVFLYSNDTFLDTAKVSDGIFTYNAKGFEDGQYTIYAEAVLTDDSKNKSNSITVIVRNTLGKIEGLSSSNLPIVSTVSPETKNLLNLVFALVFALIFLIDFILLEYTDMFGRRKSLSHFNFSIFIIIALIIIVGGFGGHLTETSAIT